MAAVIRRLFTRPGRLRQDENVRVREWLLAFPDGDDGGRFERQEVRQVIATYVADLDRQTASLNRWSFVMLSPSQNELVVNHLVAHSRRGFIALRLWALCFSHLRMDTGEIVLSRGEIADSLGVLPKHVSEVMTELVDFGAMSRVREARRVRYFMNPLVGTHLSGKARDDAQRQAKPLKLVEGGGPVERRRRWSGLVPGGSL